MDFLRLGAGEGGRSEVDFATVVEGVLGRGFEVGVFAVGVFDGALVGSFVVFAGSFAGGFAEDGGGVGSSSSSSLRRAYRFEAFVGAFDFEGAGLDGPCFFEGVVGGVLLRLGLEPGALRGEELRLGLEVVALRGEELRLGLEVVALRKEELRVGVEGDLIAAERSSLRRTEGGEGGGELAFGFVGRVGEGLRCLGRMEFIDFPREEERRRMEVLGEALTAMDAADLIRLVGDCRNSRAGKVSSFLTSRGAASGEEPARTVLYDLTGEKVIFVEPERRVIEEVVFEEETGEYAVGAPFGSTEPVGLSTRGEGGELVSLEGDMVDDFSGFFRRKEGRWIRRRVESGRRQRGGVVEVKGSLVRRLRNDLSEQSKAQIERWYQSAVYWRC